MLKLSFYQDRIQTTYYPLLEKTKSKQIDDWHYQKDNAILLYDYAYAKKRTNYRNKSIRRTRQTVEYIGKNNTFTHFLSITFIGQYVDRKDTKAVHERYKNILKRIKYVYGEIDYLRVPEFHKDGAVHYHLFVNFKDRNPKLKYKGLSSKGQALYTIQDEDLNRYDCFITVEKISKNAPIHYLTKYLTKSSDCPLSRRYACSKGLNRPKSLTALATYKFDIEFNPDFYQQSDLYFELGIGCYSESKFCLCTSRYYGEVAQLERSEQLDLSISHIKDEKTTIEYREKLRSIFFREVLRLIESGAKLVFCENTLA